MKETIKKEKSSFNKFIWMTGIILVIIGAIVTIGTLIAYPIYSLTTCQAFTLKWLLWMLLKWFLYTEGAAFILMIGYIMSILQINK